MSIVFKTTILPRIVSMTNMTTRRHFHVGLTTLMPCTGGPSHNQPTDRQIIHDLELELCKSNSLLWKEFKKIPLTEADKSTRSKLFENHRNHRRSDIQELIKQKHNEITDIEKAIVEQTRYAISQVRYNKSILQDLISKPHTDPKISEECVKKIAYHEKRITDHSEYNKYITDLEKEIDRLKQITKSDHTLMDRDCV
jgi:hypothetical protein